MSFHLGRPILVMLVVSLLCAVVLGVRSGRERRADLTLWVFDEQQQRIYTEGSPSLIEQFRQQTGKSVRVELVPTRAEDVRLTSMFMSDSRDVPDVVELEIGSVAKYFRPAVRDIGLLPLNDFLARSGWRDRIVNARFAPWSKHGVIFGVPHDVHPVVLAYREDLYREAGIDLAGAKTWPAFAAACLRFQEYWKAHGVPHRHAMELQNSSADHLIPMLLQRHLNPINGRGEIEMTQPKFVDTVAFYAQCIAGPGNISAQAPAAAGGLERDLLEGNICVFMCADWRIDQIKALAPSLAGKMRMMAMPVFEAGDAQTATWGGTMIGIPRRCKDPELSWKLIEFLYFSRPAIEARRRYSSVLPPIKTMWDDPVYQQGDPYFSGQKTGKLLIEMARQLPERYVTPATTMASGYLSKVIGDAAGYVRKHPGDEAGLRQQCRAWLAEVAKDLQRRLEHGNFDE